MTTTTPIIRRPRYESAKLSDALRADWRGCHLSQKLDGVWAVRSFAGGIYTGEAMRGGSFFAFDVCTVRGQDVRRLPWIERRAALLEMARSFPAGWSIAPEGHGVEFVEAVLSAGGEGVVAKDWQSPFGLGWTKIKRVETFDCTVTELSIATGSIRLALAGEDCGWCPARAAFNQIRRGAVVEVAAYGRHTSGKFREARFVRVRQDKIFEVKQ